MLKYTIHETKTQLSKILRKVAQGEEVIIVNRDKPVAKLSPLTSSRRLGFLEGQVSMSEDFDDPLEDFAKYRK